MGMPTTAEWRTMTEMAEVLQLSGMLPRAIVTKEQAVAVILKGHELGLQPMQSFSSIHVISGKPTASSEFMLGLLAKGGVTWDWIEKGENDQAIIEFRREGFAAVRGTFTKAEAQQAKLTGKDTWKNYPANMLRARAVANGARMIGPDLLMGMSYTPEEMGADVDENEDPTGPSSQQQQQQQQPPPEAEEAEDLVAVHGPDAGDPVGYAKTTFKTACEGVIANIADLAMTPSIKDKKDQAAIVLTGLGFTSLDDVPADYYRRVFDGLKAKRTEIEEKRIVEEDVKAATKLAAN